MTAPQNKWLLDVICWTPCHTCLDLMVSKQFSLPLLCASLTSLILLVRLALAVLISFLSPDLKVVFLSLSRHCASSWAFCWGKPGCACPLWWCPCRTLCDPILLAYTTPGPVVQTFCYLKVDIRARESCKRHIDQARHTLVVKQSVRCQQPRGFGAKHLIVLNWYITELLHSSQ